MGERPRPEGFDYSKPDAKHLRCMTCNPDGMNRTGWKILGLIGTSTTTAYATDCAAGCDNGLNAAAVRGDAEIASWVPTEG